MQQLDILDDFYATKRPSSLEKPPFSEPKRTEQQRKPKPDVRTKRDKLMDAIQVGDALKV